MFEIPGGGGGLFGSTFLDILLTSHTEDGHINKHVCYTSCVRRHNHPCHAALLSPLTYEFNTHPPPASSFLSTSSPRTGCLFFSSAYCVLFSAVFTKPVVCCLGDGPVQDDDAFLAAAAGNYADESSERSEVEGCKTKPIICN